MGTLIDDRPKVHRLDRAQTLAQVQALHDAARLLDAWQLSQTLGPLESWRGSSERVLAARLASKLGAHRKSAAMAFRGFREHPQSPETRYYHCFGLLSRRGPLACWEGMAALGDIEPEHKRWRADWLALRGHVAALLRDFDEADRHLTAAEALAPEEPWIWVERSSALELQDRYPEALAAARRALEVAPGSRNGTLSTAHMLTLVGRDDEALALLENAAGRMQAGDVVIRLAMLQTELGHYEAARANYDRLPELHPLAEPDMLKWICARRADAAYYCGDYEAAAELSAAVDEPLFQKLAERLRDPQVERRRKLLSFGFVRQHHVTCAPATLTNVSRFWSMPAEHLQVAEEICYDGTPEYSERNWAERNGWMTREFRLDGAAVRALIDRGVPFTLATYGATGGHLQAVFGYDCLRQSFLIRDPYIRLFIEAREQEFLEFHRTSGPRGMALVPRAQANLLDNLLLPDADLYDVFHELQGRLEQHDRPAAQQACARLGALAPDHRLTFHAQRSLAAYDANSAGMLAAIERLLESDPKNARLLLTKLGCLRELGRREDRLALLAEITADPACDPIFKQQHARELSEDAREHEMASLLMRQAIRGRPLEAVNYHSLAMLAWDQGRRERALALYRMAACLDDKDERCASSYFQAARWLRRTDEAVQFLAGRFARFGKRSGFPVRTFFWALTELDRTDEAFAELERALALRPEDGDLALFAADAFGRFGRFERADALLAQAETGSSRLSWLRTAAGLARYRCRSAEALGFWRQVLAVRPLDVEAYASIDHLMAELESPAAATEFLQQALEKFPHFVPLHEMYVQSLRGEDMTGREAALRRLLEVHPTNAWAQRELALVLMRQRRLDEALAQSRSAGELEPNHPSQFMVAAAILALAARRAEAMEANRAAIRLSVDADVAIYQLMGLCDTPAQRRAELDFIQSELVRQVIFGDGLLAFASYARDVLTPEELESRLREARTARPDLWHAWSALIIHLVETQQLDEADALSVEYVERFALLPVAWMDRARVCRRRKDRAAAVAALEQALAINPGFSAATRALAELHEDDEDWARSRSLLETAVARRPLEAVNHGCLADALWKLGEREPALERLRHALQLDPGYDWAWAALRDWTLELERPAESRRVARELTERRPGEARSWLVLARMLAEPQECDERLAAINRALELNPWLTEAHSLRIRTLVDADRLDEAAAACRPASFADRAIPAEMRLREAQVADLREGREQAIALAEAVSRDEPNYYGAWSLLCDWYEGNANHAERYLEAAQQMVRIAPESHHAHGTLGDALQGNRALAEARTAFERALELNPAYTFAALNLCDLLFDSREWEAADKLLAGQQAVEDNAFVAARQVRVSIELRRAADAEARLRRVCRLESPNNWPLSTAVKAFTEADWRVALRRVLTDEVVHADAQPEVGRWWVETGLDDPEWFSPSQAPWLSMLDTLSERPAVWSSAVSTLLEVAADRRQIWVVRKLLNEQHQRLHADAFTWGSMGYALGTIGDQAEAARWLRRDPARGDVAPWMLTNLVNAELHLGDMPAAMAAARRALTLQPDFAVHIHRAWLALDHALAGRYLDACHELERIDRTRLEPYHSFLCALADSMVAAAGEPPGWLPPSVATQYLDHGKALLPKFAQHQLLLKFYNQTLWHLGKNCGALGWVWALFSQEVGGQS